jgi:hypothetical protein
MPNPDQLAAIVEVEDKESCRAEHTDGPSEPVPVSAGMPIKLTGVKEFVSA